MSGAPASIDFTVGSRRLLSVPRQLHTLSFSLEDILGARTPPMPELQGGVDGYRMLSVPLDHIDDLVAKFPGYLTGGRQDYRRFYIDMAGGYDAYLARFSGKTRSTLRRKQRKLTEACGGECRMTEYRTPAEVERFLELTLPLSARTYQARLLDAGLPETSHARTDLLQLAEEDRLRCFLLSNGNTPIAYLALPIRGGTLVYAWLGYDPDWARLSPGTVLQMDALERLFSEERHRWFDFTEGEGAHKEMFATDHVACASFVLLRGNLPNRLLLGARAGFDAAVSGAKAIAGRGGALAGARKLLKA